MALVIFLSQRHKNGCLNKGTIAVAEEHFPFKSTQISDKDATFAAENDLDPLSLTE